MVFRGQFYCRWDLPNGLTYLDLPWFRSFWRSSDLWSGLTVGWVWALFTPLRPIGRTLLRPKRLRTKGIPLHNPWDCRTAAPGPTPRHHRRSRLGIHSTYPLKGSKRWRGVRTPCTLESMVPDPLEQAICTILYPFLFGCFLFNVLRISRSSSE